MRPSRDSLLRPASPTAAAVLAVVLAALAGCAGVWPQSSTLPVVPLDHPLLADKAGALRPPPSAGYRFVVFGDQRALADGEWQDLLALVARRAEQDPRLLFALDTGDCVEDGTYTDQWAMLARILAPIDGLPYLVAVGNHEVNANRNPAAREHTARFFAYLDEDFGPRRMYYRKDVGPVTFLFLDTNELVYGPVGAWAAVGPPGRDTAAERQFAWLAAQLAALPPERTVVVVMHHPFVQSSRMHLPTARGLWNVEIAGRAFPDLLVDAGVDVALVGHTHTYERFRLEREDGRVLHVVNVSGRPRGVFGASRRRVVDIRGREAAFFAAHGFTGLDGWEISQRAAMLDPERNQLALFEVAPDGGLTMQVLFLEEGEETVAFPPVELE